MPKPYSEDFRIRVIDDVVVARRHGLTPQQVFTWRRQARQAVASSESRAPQFVPAIVGTVLPSPVLRARHRKRTGQANRSSGSIEVEIDGMTVRIGRGVEAKTVAAVLRALKAGA